MFLSDFLKRLLTHVASAALVFSVVAISMEVVMPGFVLPYLNPIPFAIAGLLGLAVGPNGASGIGHRAWKGRLLLILTVLIIVAALILFANENGRLGMAVTAWLILSMIAIVVSIWPKKAEKV
jgi:hypothetical protein